MKERLLQVVSVTTQVAISLRVSRFTLQLRNHQDARRSQGGEDDVDPHQWRGDEVWTRSSILEGMVIKVRNERRRGGTRAASK